ncbi:hypothetical protein MRB53_037598 [Persea americana]|nr:hypothetical protein MRB53_037598 [Persea americana]
MPKKRSRKFIYTATETRNHGAANAEGIHAPQSVNERLEHLRRAQSTASIAERRRRLEPTDQPASVPLARRRPPPGPAAPPSWATDDDDDHVRSLRSALEVQPSIPTYFPNCDMHSARFPDHGTLLHHTLKLLAEDFYFHAESDAEYLCSIPCDLRVALLSYIAAYSTPRSFSASDLAALFPVMSGDVVHRLDLGAVLSPICTLDDIHHFLKRRSAARGLEPPEAWDASLHLRAPQSRTLTTMTITHLSLAHPDPASASWTSLISLMKDLPQLTHLSLAAWPIPSLAAAPAALQMSLAPNRPTLTTSVEQADASCLLGTFARATPGLVYLDLSECHDWIEVLRLEPSDIATASRRVARSRDLSPEAPHMRSGPSLNWATHWLRLRKLRVSCSCSGVSPPFIDAVKTAVYAADPQRTRAAGRQWNAEVATSVQETIASNRNVEKWTQWLERLGAVHNAMEMVKIVRRRVGAGYLEIDYGSGGAERSNFVTRGDG